MQVLVSPTSAEEARLVCESEAHIVDIKNVHEGSLGANFPWVIREVVEMSKAFGKSCSATLGDLPNKPGTAALAAAGATTTGVDYIKAGLHGVRDYDDAANLMKAVVRATRERASSILIVAAGYADFRRFNGLPAKALIMVARDAKADFVMVDTAIKDGTSLFDSMTRGELQEFVGMAHEEGLKVALAGCIRFENLAELRTLSPDLIGVRGCLCRSSDRTKGIDGDLINQFVSAAIAPSI